MAGSPTNFLSHKTPFYSYENTSSSFPDLDDEHVTKSPNIGPSSSNPPLGFRKQTSGVWQLYGIAKFPNKDTSMGRGTWHLKRHAAKQHDPTQI